MTEEHDDIKITPDFLKESGMYVKEEEVQELPQPPAPMNRAQRRKQKKRFGGFKRKKQPNWDKMFDELDKLAKTRAVDLPPEDKERVYRTLLHRVQEENRKIREEMEKEKENE